MTKDRELPPLPSICNGVGDYTADQMREYARSAIADFARTLAQRMDMEAALAQKAEPVAWIEDAAWGRSLSFEKPNYGQAAWKAPTPKLIPLYTAPPQRRIKVEKIPPRRLPDDDAQETKQ